MVFSKATPPTGVPSCSTQMILLGISILALSFGPVVFRLARHRRRVLDLLDVFVVGSISLLVAIELVPSLFGENALVIVMLAGVGLFGPTIVEFLLHASERHRTEHFAHLSALSLGLGGFFLHATLDGAVLASGIGASDTASLLPLAVILHRIPTGLAVWWLLGSTFGTRVPAVILTIIAGGTIVGYVVGPTVLDRLAGPSLDWFQALIAGSLLHVVFFRRHMDHG